MEVVIHREREIEGFNTGREKYNEKVKTMEDKVKRDLILF